MILKAIERGVPEEKIAAALDLNPRSIQRKVRLLEGICPEAVAILKDKELAGRGVAKYGSIRALSHRSLGEPAEAARWYDTVLGLEPRHERSTQCRRSARVLSLGVALCHTRGVG